MNVCVNCDHLEECHSEPDGCARIVQGNDFCVCKEFKPAKEQPVVQTAPQMIITPDADLQRYMQEMVHRMMFNQKLTD